MLRTGKPQATLKAGIRNGMYKEWGEEWNSMKMANHAKSFYGGPNPGKASFVYKLARMELGRLVRIVTGHNNLGFFQTKIGLAKTPLCRLCGGGDETITHFILACPRLLSFQKEVFLDDPPTADMKWSVRKLIDFSYHPQINEAYEGTGAVGMDDLDESYALGWLDCEENDENNNSNMDRSRPG